MADDNTSADDALQTPGTLFRPGQDEPKLAEDNDPPAAPADDTDDNPIPDDHPETDSNIDAHELYDEGLTAASEINAAHEGPDDEPRPLNSAGE